MNGEIFTINVSQMGEIIDKHLSISSADRRTLVSSGNVSMPLLAGFFRGNLMCFVGFVPQTMLSDTAYMWLYHTISAREYPIVFGRHARRVVSRALEVYSTLIGDCRTSSAIRWLMTLGAEIEAGRFVIRRAE
jgi:hypothetical protein